MYNGLQVTKGENPFQKVRGEGAGQLTQLIANYIKNVKKWGERFLPVSSPGLMALKVTI
jgi:hypothetical protein